MKKIHVLSIFKKIMSDRITAFILLCCFVLFSFDVYAGPSCPDIGKAVKVSVSTDLGQTLYFHNRKRSDIEAYARRNNVMQNVDGKVRQAMASRSGSQPHIPGITLASFEIAMNIATTTGRLKNNNGYCIYPDKIDVTLRYPKMEVYVANMYKKSSCEYKVILEHEKTHVSIFHKTLGFYSPYIEQSIKNVVNKIKPVWSAYPNQEKVVSRSIMNYINEKIKPTVSFFRNVQKQENKKIDTLENYSRTKALCSNW